MLIDVKSIAFGMSRYSTRWHLDGATWTERRAAEAVKERDGAPAAIDAEVFAGVVPPPMQTQIQRMGGMSSAVIGGFCEHSPVVHERAMRSYAQWLSGAGESFLIKLTRFAC